MKRKEKQKKGAKMELRRDGTINTHPFSHPWSTENQKKEGGENFKFFLHETRSKHQKLVNSYKPWNYKVEEHNQVEN